MSDENLEQQALELGWQPEEDFKADPKNEGKEWRTAKEFLDRKPLFDKIDGQSKEIKDLRRAVQSLGQQNKKIEELAYKRALEELKAEKVRALEEGEHTQVVQIDEKIADLKAQQVAQPQAPTPTEEFQEWVENNKWYVEDREMRSIADGIGLSLHKEGVPPSEIMDQVSQRIKKVFPEKFGKARVPPSPEGSGARKGNSSSSVESLLTPTEKRIMDTILATGSLSKEEYIKQFAAVNPERFKGVKL